MLNIPPPPPKKKEQKIAKYSKFKISLLLFLTTLVNTPSPQGYTCIWGSKSGGFFHRRCLLKPLPRGGAGMAELLIKVPDSQPRDCVFEFRHTLYYVSSVPKKSLGKICTPNVPWGDR